MLEKLAEKKTQMGTQGKRNKKLEGRRKGIRHKNSKYVACKCQRKKERHGENSTKRKEKNGISYSSLIINHQSFTFSSHQKERKQHTVQTNPKKKSSIFIIPLDYRAAPYESYAACGPGDTLPPPYPTCGPGDALPPYAICGPGDATLGPPYAICGPGDGVRPIPGPGP